MTTAPTAAPAERIELTRMRRAIAAVTVQSKRETPHFYITAEIDMTQAMALRRQINDALQDGTRVSVNDMIVKAATKTLETFPKFNASFQEDHLQIHPDINIGIAIALDEGLIVPAIMGCQNKSLAEIARASGDLGQRAQGGTLRTEEYTGSTFSISNLGMFGAIDSFAAIIFPPNAAVLAVGTVKEQPVVREGQITVAQIMKGTISVDHRVADGAEGAQFLMELKRHLENPVSLLLLGGKRTPCLMEVMLMDSVYNSYTAVVQRDGPVVDWMGQGDSGCQLPGHSTREELIENLHSALKEALEMNIAEAMASTTGEYEEVSLFRRACQILGQEIAWNPRKGSHYLTTHNLIRDKLAREYHA